MVLAHDITKGDRTQDVKINQDVTFETMLLAPNTLQGLKDAGFYKPSPVQLYGIPIGKCGFDLLLEAKSGTGKTAVFCVIALETIDFQKGLQVVILTPTREIAAQICDVLNEIGSRYKDLRVAVVMGGLPFQEDVEKFKNPVHIVVGSPGRLKHLLQNKNINTATVRLLVLDEADKLMDKSFQADIKFIHTMLPKQKQVIMSSATYTDSAKAFINSYMQNANHVCPDSDSILLGIEQKVTVVKYNSNIVRLTQDRFKELLRIITKIQFKQCLVFCNYQARVLEVNKLLKKEKWPSEMLSGQQEQTDRLDALKTLQQYKCRILVSTDLAARGIDASNVDLIVNFEPPYEWQTYLHRIGRAGRFGSHGVAITILSEGKETQNFKDMFKSMELSINMHHLWTNSEFSVATSVTPLETCIAPLPNPKPIDLSEEKNVWEMLNQNTTERNSIESFENLCKSQNDQKITEIKPFSDFVASIQNHSIENNEENLLFKHIEMKTSSSVCLFDKENCNTTCSDDNIPIQLNKPRNVKEHNNKEEAKRDYYIKLDNATDVNDNCLNINNSLSTENNVWHSRVSKTHRDSQLMNHNASIWKEHKIMSNVPNSGYSNPGNNNNNTMETHSTRYAKRTDTKDDVSIGNNLNNNSINHKESKANKSDRKNANRNRKNISNKEHKYNDTGNHSEIEVNENIQSVSYFNNNEKNKIANYRQEKMYVNWYNQLKIRMQSIEQAIYIDELSQL